jgi:uncharacterized membrane protein YbhN (UPF0104 family)
MDFTSQDCPASRGSASAVPREAEDTLVPRGAHDRGAALVVAWATVSDSVRRRVERLPAISARTWNRWLGLVLILAAGSLYYTLNRQAFQGLRVENWHLLPLLVGVQLARLAVNGLVLQAFVGVFDVRLRRTECLGLAAVMALGSYLATGAGGAALQGGALKHRFGLPYARFVALTAASYLLSASLASVVGLTVYVLYYREAGFAAWPVVALVVIVSALTAIAVTGRPQLQIGSSRAPRWLGRISAGWHMLWQRPEVLARVALFMAVNLALYALALRLAFAVFAVPVGAPPALLMAAVGSLSVVVPITPGNLGVLETITATISHLVGFGFHVGLAAQSMARAAALVNVFVLGPVFSYRLLKK